MNEQPYLIPSASALFEEEIKKRGWILGSPGKKYLRFTTPDVNRHTYINQNSNGWRNKESFLFEFVLNPEKDRMNTKIVISPSDSNYDTLRLSNILMELDGFKTPYGKKWLVNYQKLEKFPFSKIEEEDEIRIEFNKILDKFQPVVEKVENQFIKYSDELIKMMS